MWKVTDCSFKIWPAHLTVCCSNTRHLFTYVSLSLLLGRRRRQKEEIYRDFLCPLGKHTYAHSLTVTLIQFCWPVLHTPTAKEDLSKCVSQSHLWGCLIGRDSDRGHLSGWGETSMIGGQKRQLKEACTGDYHCFTLYTQYTLIILFLWCTLSCGVLA